ncbi:VOC family protein [Streptomyces sp. SPB4]|uniref:VOC family protein n=1 Tax=Streptomyces sp. SPB4 TaxID=2940553 RepID=UPI0024752776|nr:VOC family protein [Streptomyces sp. SPB4]MDH6537612.1 putative 3-demethylubiquinone-9 3-methyltransferase (glyoxalase superfamily) [Streptomyces sp. SPB4]
MASLPQKITTFLMFEGRAEEAMNLYTSLFEDSGIIDVVRYGAEGPGEEGTVVKATFSLAGQRLMCIDSHVKHDFGFTPSVSLFVECGSVAEIDRLYGALAEGGQELMPLDSYGFSPRFGWLNDRFGVSWQLNLPADPAEPAA